MENTPFNEQSFIDSGMIFSKEINQNKWVLYHGTSSINEESILSEGLVRPSIEKDVVENIVSIYESSGLQRLSNHDFPELNTDDAYLHLKSFTLEVDFEGGRTMKPIYFSELPCYAFTYTASRYAGGETISAINCCIEILQRYCSNESYREFILQRIWRQMRKTYGYMLPSNVRHLDSQKIREEDIANAYDSIVEQIGNVPLPRSILTLNEIRTQVDEYKSSVMKYIEAISGHEYGIILAVEFNEEDLDNFLFRDSGLDHGFGYMGNIPVEQIIGICRVYSEKYYPEVRRHSFNIKQSRMENTSDIVFHLNSRKS